MVGLLRSLHKSPSSRRAWIEIVRRAAQNLLQNVALLAEGVDRNSSWVPLQPRKNRVALLAEGVDRNSSSMPGCAWMVVALLAEGVDRNVDVGLHV